MIMKIRRMIALTFASFLLIITIGRYRFNATGLPLFTEDSLIKRIAVTLKIGKMGRRG
ncbi:hypothetical protein Geob_3867 [Geotalea daltonii FRC-32]|uniref:Uncharacterized protein n=1 Tax=Geotalea daltonii (strain DSM 22248 / JCM 15807 / FRC-32) TaxID=316067 RepID=A0A068F119_GEODF|nr:hypothetical protein Geob_3867 [Geotalea daltonii FRC-32]